MAQYKVKTIAIAVKNNRIARFGETVDDSELTVNANELINAGSIELIAEKPSKKEAVVAAEKADAKIAETEEVEEKKIEKAPTAAEKADAKK